MTDATADRRGQPSPFRQAFRTGLRTAASLIVIMIAALLAANRIPALEAYALERNAVFFTLFVLVTLIPVVRFLKHPRQMFVSAMVGWVLFAGAYDLAGHFFRNLFDVLRTPFELLVEGAAVYGVCAVGSWVVEMIHHARRHPMVLRRKPPRQGTSGAHHNR
jgi:membrane protease YdiL (CAAX protease family)